MTRTQAFWAVLLIVILGVCLRVWELPARSIWFDEAFSWRLIQYPWLEVIQRDSADVHPPLYYLLLKGWVIVFGESLWGIRSLSVVLSGASIAVAYALLHHSTRSRAAGLVAAALVAVSGFQMQYASEARMYMLGCLLALLSTWLLLKLIDARRGWAWAIAYGLCAVAFAYTHYFALFSLAAQALFVVGYLFVTNRGRIGEVLQSRLFWQYVTALVLAAALFSPWVPVLLRQNQQVQASFWIPELTRWSIPDTAFRMLIPRQDVPRDFGHVGWKLVSLAPLVGLMLASLWLLFWASWQAPHKLRGVILIILMGLVPIILSSAVSLLTPQTIYQDRYLIFAQVFVVLLVAQFILSIAPKVLRRAAIAIILLGFIAAAAHYQTHLQLKERPGTQAAAQALLAQVKPSEPVLTNSPFIYLPFLYHVTDGAMREPGAANAPIVKLFSESGQIVHFAGGPVLQTSDFIGSSLWTEATVPVWVVDTTGFGAAPLLPPLPWVASHTERFPEVFEYQGEVMITRYEKK